MKIALYEILDNAERYQYLEEATEFQEANTRYIRISNIIKVDFEMIDDALIIPKKVEAIRAEKAVAMEKFDEKIAKLQAITYQPDGEEEGS
jgi:hypothetical protein